MTKLFCKKILAALLIACIMVTVGLPVLSHIGLFRFPEAGATVEAVPAKSSKIVVSARRHNGLSYGNSMMDVPIYAIQQANGYSSSYMKLRDIAYYMDFDVVWNEAEPNAMRLYSNRHYLDIYTPSGPAVETKLATESAMDIYINDVKVNTDIKPVMIENNNYFKIRDIARLMDFWCDFHTDYQGWIRVLLDIDYHYIDEAAIAAGVKKDDYAKNFVYEDSAYYDESCGTVSDTPVVYSPRDPWGNYDYTKLYFGKTDHFMNAIAQLMLDRDIIEQDHSGVAQFGDGNTLNAYYRYPVVKYSEGGLGRPAGKSYYLNKAFVPNLKIYPISDKIGLLSIEYNADSRANWYTEEVRKAATEALNEMNEYGCDREKIMFLAYKVCEKMSPWREPEGSPVDTANRAKLGIPETVRMEQSNAFNGISMWWNSEANDTLYYGVCQNYYTCYTHILTAAGYYSMPDYSSVNHVRNIVWIPDEGRWAIIDCSTHKISPRYLERSSSGTWEHYYYEGDNYLSWVDSEHFGEIKNREMESHEENVTATLDFFYMMEDIKPGTWLSRNYEQNPWGTGIIYSENFMKEFQSKTQGGT